MSRRGFVIHDSVNILNRIVRHVSNYVTNHVTNHVAHRHYASVHNEQHHWAHFERVFNVHQRRYEAVLAEHTHLFMPDRSTRVNVKKTEAIFNNTDEYSHFTRNVSNFFRRFDTMHVENHSLSQVSRAELAALSARIAALEAQLA